MVNSKSRGERSLRLNFVYKPGGLAASVFVAISFILFTERLICSCHMFKPELLSPAGTLKSMRYAFAYGADAIYAGQARYSLRVRNNEFTNDNLALGIAEAHAKGKKFYVVSNIAPHNSKLKSFVKDLRPVVEMQPDAFIMSDPGLIMLMREAFPDVSIHLSVQANAVNWASVKFWKTLGLSRIVLSRELSLAEIEEIRGEVPDIELEVFVHGAICMAYSGRCLLSGYINRRDSNQGVCSNVCRWRYKVGQGEEDAAGHIKLREPGASAVETGTPPPTLGIGKTTDQVYIVEEIGRPGDHLSAFEDEHGSYIMNSRDLRAIEHVAELMRIGVHSLKIEGRTKSFYYCARTAQAYRKAIDDAAAGKPFDPSLLHLLDSLANRGYTDGFLRRQTHDAYQNYESGISEMHFQRFVGEFTGEMRNGLAQVVVKNKFMAGDSVELMTPQGNTSFLLDGMENEDGQKVSLAPGDGHIVYIPLPVEADLSYALLMGRVIEQQPS